MNITDKNKMAAILANYTGMTAVQSLEVVSSANGFSICADDFASGVRGPELKWVEVNGVKIPGGEATYERLMAEAVKKPE